ncbi:MAG TPA: hypothetical protein VKU02_22245 [Gemmataceae bacterium]|nr:hypothetical protein [Gemmataceae bacterium]
MSRFPLNTIVNFRACGDCQACCTVVGVEELHKPNWTRCEQQCETGCAIYPDRPRTCRGYSCLWAAGLLEGEEERRPDRLGILLDLRSESNSDSVRPGDRVLIQAWEVWPGAMDQPESAALLNQIAERCLVLVRQYGSEAAVVYPSEP